jgi:transposase
MVKNRGALKAVGFVELLAAPSAQRRWSDEADGQMVAETLVVGVTVTEVSRRYGVKANHMPSWRTLALQGKLVVRDVAGAEFVPPVAMTQTLEPPVATGTVDLIIGLVTVRLDAATPSARVAELVIALRACA